MSKLSFQLFFLALAGQTWAFQLHPPVPIASDGTDQPSSRYSFGQPIHLIWDLDDAESGKITFRIEPMLGPNLDWITLAEGVDMSDLETVVRINPKPPWPSVETYYLHALNSSNLKQVYDTTSNFWVFDTRAQTATLTVASGTLSRSLSATSAHTSNANQVSSFQTSVTLSNEQPSSGTSSSFKSSSITMSITQSSNSSMTHDLLPSSTITTSSGTSLVPAERSSPTGTTLPASTNQNTSYKAIVGGVIGSFAFVFLLIGLLFLHRRRRNRYLTPIPVTIVPSAYSPPPIKPGTLYTNSPVVPEWPPSGMAQVPRERQKSLSGLNDIPQAPVAPHVENPDPHNDADYEEDARRLRYQAEAMNERIAELESQLVHGLDMGNGHQPPEYASPRQSVVPRCV